LGKKFGRKKKKHPKGMILKKGLIIIARTVVLRVKKILPIALK